VVIGENGEQFGAMRTDDALRLAYEKGLDLIEVSPNITPPVCKIMDYGKYLYKATKRRKQQIAKQKKIEVKTIRLSARIEKHDLEFKAKNAIKFMKKGNKVKLEMTLKGRERAHMDFARGKLDNFLKIISDMSEADPQTAKKEIVKEQDIKMTPQGFVALIDYKRS